jgi:3-methyladenine DNA glycosylase AlkC
MAGQLKNAFSVALVRGIADDLRRVHPGFAHAAFLRQATRGFPGLELTGRARQVSVALHQHLPAEYDQLLRVLVASLGPPLTVTAGFGLGVFRYLPHVYLIAEHGPAHPRHLDASLEALLEVTRRFTAEWGIRPFIEQHYDHTMATLARWAGHHDVHVRRLVSEGTRPRLPWAGRLRCFQRDPTPAIALLDRLVDDDEAYVRRSVANHLGDIAKDHPDLAVATAARWIGARDHPGRRWIAGHGLRSLAKAGHRGALGLLGCAERPQVRVTGISIAPRRVEIGGRVDISFTLAAEGRRAQELRIDLVVHYVKADGSTRPKVFILERLRLEPDARLVVTHGLKLADLTTRRHHPGGHRLELLMNGERLPLGTFTLQR